MTLGVIGSNWILHSTTVGQEPGREESNTGVEPMSRERYACNGKTEAISDQLARGDISNQGDIKLIAGGELIPRDQNKID